MSIVGPKIGEYWAVGSLINVKYIGTGRDFSNNKFLLFTSHDGFHVISKDEFYKMDFTKEKVS